MNISPFKPTAEDEAFMAELKAVVGNHKDLDAIKMLAITAQLVGSLIAIQDQRFMTPEDAIELVSKNIEVGNAALIDHAFGNPQGRA